MSELILKIVNLTKIYDTEQATIKALDQVYLTINQGETIALLGPNGAGKTTLSSILATLHPATKGDVLYKSASIYKNIYHYRKNLGFCPQKPNLDPFLNVEQNLIFAGKYFLMTEKLIKDRVYGLMEQLDLMKYAKFDVDNLSGGNKQRVLIARALLHDPEIIILDEPTVGLDPDIRRQLWKIIQELKKLGKTIIITTHYLDEAEILSDRVCILSKGKILLTEKISSLKETHKKEKLEEIFLNLMEQEQNQ